MTPPHHPPSHPRPIHRWKTLWLGLLVLACIGWAWARSESRQDFLMWGTTGGGITTGQSESCLWLSHSSSPFYVPPGLQTATRDLESDSDWFPPAVFVSLTSDYHIFTIAHWLLGLCFLIPWLTFLAWRHRKQEQSAIV